MAAPGHQSTNTAVRARLEARRNEDLVIAESALAGERRVSIARIALVLLFASSHELIARAGGVEVPFDPVRVTVAAIYLTLAIATAVQHRVRAVANPTLARWAPVGITLVDFSFFTFMGARDAVAFGTLPRPEMGAIAFAVLLCFSVARFSWLHVALSTFLACACYLGLGLTFGVGDLWTTSFVVCGFLGLGGLVAAVNRSVRAMFRDLRRRDALTRFLPVQVAERIIAGGDAALAPVQREVTILFTDLRGFTTYAETLPPREVLAFLDDLFARLSQVVRGHDGVVNKFLGDGMLAVWGAPDPDPDHAGQATAAALDIRRAVAELNRERAADGLPPVAIGMGLHTGPVAAGMLGGDAQVEYAVIGDAVNVASRIEALTKEHGVDLLISEPTWRLLEGRFRPRRLADTRIRGRDAPVVLYTIDDES